MVFFELRWNYSPLKEKAVLLPDGLFVILVASRQTATDPSFSCKISAPDCKPLGAWSASRLNLWMKKLCFRDKRYVAFVLAKIVLLLMQAARGFVGLAAWMQSTKPAARSSRRNRCTLVRFSYYFPHVPISRALFGG
jgi:hypothetical protein